MGRLAGMRSFCLALPWAACATLALVSSGCSRASPTGPQTIPIVFAEIGPTGKTRHLFDQAGKPVDVTVVSTLELTGTVAGVMTGGVPGMSPPGQDALALEIPEQDAARLKDWSSQRVTREVALLVGDQVIQRATLNSALARRSVMTIPTELRSAEFKAAIEYARQKVR